MITENIFELFLLENEGLLKYSLVRSIGILAPQITQYQDSEINLLLNLHAGEYQEFIDSLVELMVKELHVRMAGNGLDTSKPQEIRKDYEYEIGLINAASKKGVISEFRKESFLWAISFVAGMKGNMNEDLKELKGSGIFELVNEVLYFFGLDDMENSDGAFGYFLLALDSDPEEVIPVLDIWIEKLTVEEKEWGVETVFMWYIYSCFTDNQNESLEYCFEGLWKTTPSRSRERLIIKFNKMLDEAPDEMVCFAWELMSGGEVFMRLSDDIKRRYINSYFLFKDKMFRKPDLMNMVVSELQRYGMGMLDEKNHKAASKMYLIFYMEYGWLTDEELTANELEAVCWIPRLLYNSSPEFLECFRKQLLRFVSAKKKCPEGINRLVVMNDLIHAVNERKDLEEGKKWGMIEV